MIALCTGQPSVRHEDDRIIATIPSGSGEIEVALSYGQATRLGERMCIVVRDAIYLGNQAASAEIVALPNTRDSKGSR